MSKGRGSGFPLDFRCSVLAKVWPRDGHEYADHQVVLTGRTKSARNGKGHARKSYLSWEYRCSCGHVGWSCHRELERRAIAFGLIDKGDERIRRAGSSRT